MKWIKSSLLLLESLYFPAYYWLPTHTLAAYIYIPFPAHSLNPEMEAAKSSKLLASYHTTTSQRNPENNLNLHHHENL